MLFKKTIKSIVYFVLSKFLIRNCTDNKIYLTFDDGPHPVNTKKILKILNDYNAKASFFMVGKDMLKYPEIVKQVLAEGHGVVYHSNNHDQPKKISFKQFKNDMCMSEEIQKGLDIHIDKFYRPPYGQITIKGLIWLVLNKWKVIMWSIDSRDSFDSAEKIINNVHPDNIKNGDIILFHDDYEKTVDILPCILKEYQTKSLEYGVFN